MYAAGTREAKKKFRFFTETVENFQIMLEGFQVKRPDRRAAAGGVCARQLRAAADHPVHFQALSISKSRLYQIAAAIEPGLTISRMIARRRLFVAKKILAQPGASVRDMAEQVGIPDYNYFSKVFKKGAGMTPSGFHRKCQGGSENFPASGGSRGAKVGILMA